MPNRLEHLSDLSFLPFVDYYLNHSYIFLFFKDTESGRPSFFTVEYNTLFEPSKLGFFGQVPYCCFIGFFDLKTRMKDLIGQGTVIGQEEGPFTVQVKPAYRKESFPDIREEIRDDRAALGIRKGGDVAPWFMEKKVDFFSSCKGLPSTVMTASLGSTLSPG